MSVAEQFSIHQLVPDVISQAPKNLLKIVFAGGQEASLGNVLTTTMVKDQPILSWDYKPDALYTVIHTDPDAPTRKFSLLGEAKHWLVINVRGNDLSTGKTLAEYIGAGPPKFTGLHRYVFLVYEQPDGKPITVPGHGYIDKTTMKGRIRFKTSEFVKKFNFGTSIAGNFYQAEYGN